MAPTARRRQNGKERSVCSRYPARPAAPEASYRTTCADSGDLTHLAFPKRPRAAGFTLRNHDEGRVTIAAGLIARNNLSGRGIRECRLCARDPLAVRRPACSMRRGSAFGRRSNSLRKSVRGFPLSTMLKLLRKHRIRSKKWIHFSVRSCRASGIPIEGFRQKPCSARGRSSRC